MGTRFFCHFYKRKMTLCLPSWLMKPFNMRSILYEKNLLLAKLKVAELLLLKVHPFTLTVSSHQHICGSYLSFL